jgi:hypothetical protein
VSAPLISYAATLTWLSCSGHLLGSDLAFILGLSFLLLLNHHQK